MRFLKLKKHHRPRADGSQIIDPIIIDAPRKYAKQSERQETYLSKKKNHLITGAHDAGKSRILKKLYTNHAEIWGKKSLVTPVFISALQPVANWLDFDEFEKWYTDTIAETEFKKLTQAKKLDYLCQYVAENKAIVFVDDAHKLTGRKAEVAKECILSARFFIIACSQENRLPPSIRTLVERKEPQRTNLKTDASYDATNVLIWILIVGFGMMGAWEAALILGGLKMLGSGRRAARQD